MSKLVYLAGPIDGCTYEKCTSWREYSIEELKKDGIIGVSPMRAKDFLKEHPLLIDGVHEHILTTDAGITGRDMWDVGRSDAVLFNLIGTEKVSIGTMIEYGWASAFNKPIVTVIEKGEYDKRNIHDHPMTRRLSTYKVETLENGLAVIRALFSY